MEKLVHTPDGKLMVDDPFKIVGTKFSYGSPWAGPYKAIVTRESIDMGTLHPELAEEFTYITFTTGAWIGRTITCPKNHLTLVDA